MTRWLDIPMSVLGLAMLVLLVIGFAVPLTPFWSREVNRAETVIWLIFALDFGIELALAPSKLRYLRRNWIMALAVLLPTFGIFRVLRAVSLIRGLSLLRVLTTFNRGVRAVTHITRRGQLSYVLALTALVMTTGAAATYYFERGAPHAQINSFGAAIWWAATLITTINIGLQPVTPEGQIIAMLLRLFALGIAGYITALIAAHLIGGSSSSAPTAGTGTEKALAQIQRELGQLRRAVEVLSASSANGPPASDADHPIAVADTAENRPRSD